MKLFLTDLWHDLREKRLWPVALVLLLGLVAVPVLLAKPAGDPAPPTAAEVPAQKAQADDEDLAEVARVQLGDSDGAGSGSTLGVFDPSDPFRPPSKVTNEAKDDEGGLNGLDTAPDGTGGEVVPSGGGDAAGGGETTTGGGGETTTGGGETGGETPGGGDGTETTTTTYKYVADVTFSANGRTRRIKGLEKLDMLPSQTAPLLIFMGVTAEGGDAVFLVDSTLDAAGEGRCKPSPSDCVSTEEDGDSYTLRIDEIRKVKVTPKGQRASAGAASGARATAAVGTSRRFALPLLADLVIEAKNR
jgi:hypothetical protein